MSTLVEVLHRTTYRYDRPVSLGPHMVRLRPSVCPGATVHSYALDVTPSDHLLHWQRDPFGNLVSRVVFLRKTEVLEIKVRLLAEIVALDPFAFLLEPGVESFPFQYAAALARDLASYLEEPESGPRLTRFSDRIASRHASTVALLVDATRVLQEEIAYVRRSEPTLQTPETTLAEGSGSCRDSAWVLVHVLRRLGLAARFVSGYHIPEESGAASDPDGTGNEADEPQEGAEADEADEPELHAWAEVYLPGAGWVGLDPTTGLLASEGHIPLCCAPRPESAAPVSGSVEPCEVNLSHEVRFRYRHPSAGALP